MESYEDEKWNKYKEGDEIVIDVLNKDYLAKVILVLSKTYIVQKFDKAENKYLYYREQAPDDIIRKYEPSNYDIQPLENSMNFDYSDIESNKEIEKQEEIKKKDKTEKKAETNELETKGKIKLQIDYNDFKQLDDATKAELKSNFIWSRQNKIWIARTYVEITDSLNKFRIENQNSSDIKKNKLVKNKITEIKKAYTDKERKDIAQKLKEKANSLESQIQSRMNTVNRDWNYTNRRAGMMDSARHKADELKNIQLKLNNLAERWINDNVPETLKLIRNVSDVELLKSLNEFPKIKSNAADWAKVEIGKQINKLKNLGINEFDFLQAKEELKNLGNFELTAEEKNKKEIKELEDKFRLVKIDGFFPTPNKLANQIINKADIKQGESILEPSAGLGNIAELIRERYPDNELHCIEYQHSLQKILTKKGFNVIADDFLKYTGKFDKIIMNPPFEKGQDIEHVLHAYSCLNKGGRLVAIVSSSAYSPGSNRLKWSEFAQFVDDNGIVSEVITDAFKGSEAFKSTGVAIRIITLDK